MDGTDSMDSASTKDGDTESEGFVMVDDHFDNSEKSLVRDGFQRPIASADPARHTAGKKTFWVGKDEEGQERCVQSI